jgi:capsular polysaccharide biosynthesis protein
MHAPQLEQISLQPIQQRSADAAFDARLHNEEVLLSTLRLFWRNRKLFAGAVALAVALATIFLLLGPKQYKADSSIRLDFESGGTAATSRVALEASAVVESEARIMRSRNIAENVVTRLNLAANPKFSSPPGILTRVFNFLVLNSANLDERRIGDGAAPPVPRSPEFRRAATTVMANTTVENDTKSYLVTISYYSASPSDAATIANALVQEYLRERQVQSLFASVARLRSELGELGTSLGDKHPTFQTVKAHLAEVENRIRASETTTQEVKSVALDKFAAEIAIPAQAPVTQASPNPKAAYAIAVLLALIIIAGFLLIRQHYDTSLVSERAVTNRLGVRCLGIVPDVTGAFGPQFRPALVEAVRGVSVTAGLDVRSPNCKVILVTSSLPDEGKTQFAATLAKVLTDAGQKVLVLDAVPRVEGRVIDMPKAESAAGLLTSTRDIAPEPYHTVDLRHRGAFASIESFERYLSAARAVHDVIIIKAAPVLMLSDAAKLGRFTDMVMLLVRWRQTPGQAVTDAIRRLRDAGIRTSGVVLSNVDLKDQGSDNLWDQRSYLAEYRDFYSSISPLS